MAGLNKEIRVAARWRNREKNQVSAVNSLSNPIFDRDTNHDDQYVQDSAYVSVHPDTISGTHSVKNMLKPVRESLLKGSVVMNSKPDCVKKTGSGGPGSVHQET